MAIQERNAELVDMLRADFQPRNEMAFSWGNAYSVFIQLPGLRGLWIMSGVTGAGSVRDNSNNAMTLSGAGDVDFGLDLTTARCLATYSHFDGTGDYLYRADEAVLDITGTETQYP